MHIHVSNLHTNLIESDLMRLFTPYGEVDTVRLVRDKLNNRSLGHGFVEMPVRNEAEQAIASLHHADVKGKRIDVTEVLFDPAANSSWSRSPNA